MVFGVSYYPELIPASEWERDLTRMRETGMKVVRMLEFAWTWFEKREGEYDFAACDAFLELTRRLDMRVILGTPTASPPAWLYRQYPEIGCVTKDGRRLEYGARRGVCVNSTVYRHFSRNVAERLARRYGQHPAVMGWQIDNELIGPELRYEFVCHCHDCQWRFRDWLKSRYRSIQHLNGAWGLAFWSMQFDRWSDVSTPSRGGAMGHHLDAYRFYSDSQVEYLKLQYDAMRPHLSEEQFISHNSTGVFDRGLDHRGYARALDSCGWDAYTGAAAADHGATWPFAGLACDLFRSALGQPFWIFETDTGRKQRPSYLAELRARGAKGIFFWHWRMHRAGAEHRNPAFCDHDGNPFPERTRIVSQMIEQLDEEPPAPKRLNPADVAILYSVDCVRAQHINAKRPIPYLDTLVTAYHPLWRQGVLVDVAYPGDDLSNYRVVVMPDLFMLSAEQAEIIRRYVAAGGVLVASGGTAQMDSHGVFYPQHGSPLVDVLGLRILSGDVPDALRAVVSRKTEIGHGKLALHATPAGATVLATLAPIADAAPDGDGHDDSSVPAVLRHAFGKGHAFFQAVRSPVVTDWVTTLACDLAGINRYPSAGNDVAVIPHLTREAVWYCNHSDAPVKVFGQIIPPRQFRLIERSLIESHDAAAPRVADQFAGRSDAGRA